MRFLSHQSATLVLTVLTDSTMYHLDPRTVLVVAAHPDDEVLGCGGTIARHADQGDDVHICIFAEGARSRRNVTDSDGDLICSRLAKSARAAAKVLGAQTLELLQLPDNRLDSIDRLDIVQTIERKLNELRPSIVYVHHSGDVNIDHRRLHESCVTACRPLPGSSVTSLLTYEVPSSTEWQTPGSNFAFSPNYFVNISSYWGLKHQALKAYDSEMRLFPHPRSYEAVEHLAKWRGAQSGTSCAEAFCIIRQLSL